TCALPIWSWRAAVISARRSGASRPRKNALRRSRGCATSRRPSPVSTRTRRLPASTSRQWQAREARVNTPRVRPSIRCPPSGQVEMQLRWWTFMATPLGVAGWKRATPTWWPLRSAPGRWLHQLHLLMAWRDPGITRGWLPPAQKERAPLGGPLALESRPGSALLAAVLLVLLVLATLLGVLRVLLLVLLLLLALLVLAALLVLLVLVLLVGHFCASFFEAMAECHGPTTVSACMR